MNENLSAFPIRRRPHGRLLKTRIFAPALAAFFGPQCTPLQADESADEARLNAVSTPQAAVPWMSGGASEGPLLYLQLPPGTNQASAMIGGGWQKRRIQVAGGGRTARAAIVARRQ